MLAVAPARRAGHLRQPRSLITKATGTATTSTGPRNARAARASTTRATTRSRADSGCSVRPDVVGGTSGPSGEGEAVETDDADPVLRTGIAHGGLHGGAHLGTADHVQNRLV